MKPLFARSICLLFAALTLAGCGKKDDASVSQEEFDSLKEGMSLDQVAEAIGGEGTKNTTEVSADAQAASVVGEVTSYTWHGPDGNLVTCVFVKGSMIQKTLHD